MILKIGTKLAAQDKNTRKTEWEIIEITERGNIVLSPLGKTKEKYEEDFKKLIENNPNYDFGTFQSFARTEVEEEWFNQRKITFMEENL